MSHVGDEHLGGYFEHGECSSHDEELDEETVDAMLKSVVASPVLAYRAPLILEGHISDATYGDVNLQQKDMLLALDLGRKMGVPVPLGAAANEMLNACRGLGLSHHDFVTVYEVYRRLGGMSK